MAVEYGQHYRGYRRTSENVAIERLAKGLGWLSIGLGVFEVIAPERAGKLIGMSDGNGKNTLLRVYGLREIVTGIGILSGRRQADWLWGRVAGDMVDLVTLGAAMSSSDSRRDRVGMATAAVLGVTALDVYCGRKLTGSPSKGGRAGIARTIIINRSPREVYSFWRDIENLPTFVDQLEFVRKDSERLSHWRARVPTGASVEWDSEIIQDQANSLIVWQSLAGSDIDNSGSVRFERATGGRGTLVTVEMEYTLPGGALGADIARLFGTDPGQQVEKALRRLKQVLETGGIVKSDASIHRGARMHPAQPPQYRYRGRRSVVQVPRGACIS